jgi:1,2-diacylglycerol 3-alpha-glucosyltransferase
MRIGMFTESYWPVINGVSTSVETFRRELVRRGHDVHVFCTHYPGHHDTGNGISRFPSVRIPFRRYYPIPVPISGRVRRRFEEVAPDVVHTMSPFILGKLGMKWGRGAGIPVVSTNHTLYTEYAHYMPIVPRSLTRRYLIGRMRRFYGNCDYVLVPSGPVRELLRSWGIETPIEVTPTPMKTIEVDPGWRREIRERYAIPDDSVVAVCVGRLGLEKNVPMLIEAFAKAASSARVDARLLLVGSGPYERECRRRSRALGVEDRVIFGGWIPHADAIKCYAASDVLAHPSITETQGLTLGEGMGVGLPVVAVRAFGAVEAVDDGRNGLLTENSAEVFGAALARLLDDPEMRRRMGQESLRKVEEFSAERIVGRLENVYDTVCDAARARVS